MFLGFGDEGFLYATLTSHQRSPLASPPPNRNPMRRIPRPIRRKRHHPPPSTPEWIKFLRELTGFFSLLLWAGAVLCFVGYAIEQAADNLYLGIVLVTVVMVTGIFSYLQNSKSENLMASFAGMLPPKVKVVRSGAVDEMVASKLLPGDIVFIEGTNLKTER